MQFLAPLMNCSAAIRVYSALANGSGRSVQHPAYCIEQYVFSLIPSLAPPSFRGDFCRFHVIDMLHDSIAESHAANVPFCSGLVL